MRWVLGQGLDPLSGGGPGEPIAVLAFGDQDVAATDIGEFTAVIASDQLDRERDNSMLKALHAWVPHGKRIPLAWGGTAPYPRT